MGQSKQIFFLLLKNFKHLLDSRKKFGRVNKIQNIFLNVFLNKGKSIIRNTSFHKGHFFTPKTFLCKILFSRLENIVNKIAILKNIIINFSPITVFSQDNYLKLKFNSMSAAARKITYSAYILYLLLTKQFLKINQDLWLNQTKFCWID